ncbi:serine/threonine-protein kinase [Myxococcus landrumensis]|uniref:Serine/threonine protein kinase n=1 Tax=Myxococcus landrumensis TaxID=2813577 RepID=A0ABX7NAX7_9BACT|nr:serine/threonine-protein kinase [Myxococcus landrumus]QSQ13478.1 serine/threonine protein kinase [Myxococcus landrumus]
MSVLGGSWKPPTEVDEFRLVRLLGRGGMGAVYLAHDTSLDRLVALKLSVALQPDTSTLESFAVEARAIARIKHPNVVTVFRAGEVQGRPYLVYEYVDGKSLAELRLPLPWRYVLDIAVGLSRGLRAAHQRGVLHRDLKPGNAILDADGTLKLLDFGLAAFVGADRLMPRAMPGVVGTPRYLAPELWSGAEATPQSDLYALGLLLYELCTGGLPRTPGPLSRMPVAMESLGWCGALVERVPGIDPEFAQAIERCLAEDPQQRFTRAEALCGVLERLGVPGADPAFAAARSGHEARPWGARNML